MNICGPAPLGFWQAENWARRRGASDEFTQLAALFWTLAPQRGGVNPAVAYAQAAKETGFGHFGGTDPRFSADPSFHNTCGLKTHDASATQRFYDWRAGIAAHCDHLALYAGASGYPRLDTCDPRHFGWIAGQARTVEDLGGHWAPNPDYGRSVVSLVIEMGS